MAAGGMYGQILQDAPQTVLSTKPPSSWEMNSGNTSFSQLSLFKELEKKGSRALRFLTTLVGQDAHGFRSTEEKIRRILSYFEWKRVPSGK